MIVSSGCLRGKNSHSRRTKGIFRAVLLLFLLIAPAFGWARDESVVTETSGQEELEVITKRMAELSKSLNEMPRLPKLDSTLLIPPKMEGFFSPKDQKETSGPGRESREEAH